MRKAQKHCHPHNPSFKSVKLFMSGIWKRNSFTPVNLSFASKPSSLLFFGDNDCLSSFQFMSVFCCYKSTIIIRGGFSLVFITWNMEKNTFSSVLLSHLVWSNQPRKLRRVFRWCNEKINCLLKQFWKLRAENVFNLFISDQWRCSEYSVETGWGNLDGKG